MVNYICANSTCKKSINPELITRNVRCPYCGSKVLKKKKTAIVDSVKAR